MRSEEMSDARFALHEDVLRNVAEMRARYARYNPSDPSSHVSMDDLDIMNKWAEMTREQFYNPYEHPDGLDQAFA